ncbi:MAG TPA: SDR family oxidoreductase [Candidatus Tectomicrobia bacterium]|nr:SDR family oxidoreductase [Candidatus Tectomicrobia bacterium]
MHDKICVVTGATSGLGLVTAQALARQGATLIVVGRDPERSAATVSRIQQETGNAAVESMLADLSTQGQVRQLATEIQRRFSRLDVLVNNAGALFARRQLSQDGVEMTFALNHLAYFLLTNLLLEPLKASPTARIVNVSSEAHRGARLDFADLQAERNYGGYRVYARSKLANILFTYELARRLEGTGIVANALHPGFVATNFGRNNRRFTAGLFRILQRAAAISPAEGAQTILYLASSPQVEGITGEYFVKQKAVRSSQVSYDRAAAERLWQVSAELTRL